MAGAMCAAPIITFNPISFLSEGLRAAAAGVEADPGVDAVQPRARALRQVPDQTAQPPTPQMRRDRRQRLPLKGEYFSRNFDTFRTSKSETSIFPMEFRYFCFMQF